MDNPEMPERVRRFRERYDVSKLIIGVDRLDYIKGIPQKLTAMELLLEAHPEFIGHVSMVQVAVPSRENVKDYKDLANDLHHRVEQLNIKYGK